MNDHLKKVIKCHKEEVLVALLCPILWTVDHQAPLSMGFSRQEYYSGLPCPSPGDLPNSGIKPRCLASPALAEELFTTSTTGEGRDTRGSYYRYWLINRFSSLCLSESSQMEGKQVLRMTGRRTMMCNWLGRVLGGSFM